MEAKLSRELDVSVTLVKGSNGVFDVTANGTIVFSKDEAGRFPDDQEIVDALRQLE